MRQPIVQPSSSSGTEEIQHISEAERLRRYRANVSPEQRYTRNLQNARREMGIRSFEDINTTFLFSTIEACVQKNLERLLSLGKPIVLLKAAHDESRSASKSADAARNLNPRSKVQGHVVMECRFGYWSRERFYGYRYRLSLPHHKSTRVTRLHYR